MGEKLYHVSCADNHESITRLGLIPGYKSGYEEEPSKYLFFAKKKPSSHVNRYPRMSENLLEDYLLQMSAKDCLVYNLYEIDRSAIDNNLVVRRNDPREVAYRGIVPPQYIRLIRTYNTSELNERYQILFPKPWYQ